MKGCYFRIIDVFIRREKEKEMLLQKKELKGRWIRKNQE